METLKPCPFCGGKAFYMEDCSDDFMGWIQCEDCEADGPCPAPYKNNRDQAMKLWNTRKPPVARPEPSVY